MASTSRTWITSAEAAARLGVKPQTLYAYTSRGQLHPQRAVDGRTSRYDAAEVDRLARLGRAGGRRQGAGTVDVRLTTSLTEITDDGPRYRGLPVAALATTASFESVAEWLWTGEVVPDGRVVAGRAGWAPRLDPASGRGEPVLDLLVARCVAAAQADPDRLDRRPVAVVAAARHLVGDLVAAVPAARRADGVDVAARLWHRLGGEPATPAQRHAVNGALVLLADHDIAASTLGALVAASTRADVYHVVLAGLAVISGPLHGVASTLAVRLLDDIHRRGSVRDVVDERLRLGERLPGFGHRVYTGVDPRYGVLIDLVRAARPDRRRLAMLDELVDLAFQRYGVHPNIDLGLAALAFGFGLPVTSGECIMAIARTAGWVAHALEEYEERPLRFRPSASYVRRSR